MSDDQEWVTVEMDDEDLKKLDPDFTRRIIARNPGKYIASPDLPRISNANRQRAEP